VANWDFHAVRAIADCDFDRAKAEFSRLWDEHDFVECFHKSHYVDNFFSCICKPGVADGGLPGVFVRGLELFVHLGLVTAAEFKIRPPGMFCELIEETMERTEARRGRRNINYLARILQSEAVRPLFQGNAAILEAVENSDPESQGQTLVHLAIRANDADILMDLAELGADLNTPNPEGLTPVARLVQSFGFGEAVGPFLWGRSFGRVLKTLVARGMKFHRAALHMMFDGTYGQEDGAKFNPVLAAMQKTKVPFAGNIDPWSLARLRDNLLANVLDIWPILGPGSTWKLNAPVRRGNVWTSNLQALVQARFHETVPAMLQAAYMREAAITSPHGNNICALLDFGLDPEVVHCDLERIHPDNQDEDDAGNSGDSSDGLELHHDVSSTYPSSTGNTLAAIMHALAKDSNLTEAQYDTGEQTALTCGRIRALHLLVSRGLDLHKRTDAASLSAFDYLRSFAESFYTAGITHTTRHGNRGTVTWGPNRFRIGMLIGFGQGKDAMLVSTEDDETGNTVVMLRWREIAFETGPLDNEYAAREGEILAAEVVPRFGEYRLKEVLRVTDEPDANGVPRQYYGDWPDAELVGEEDEEDEDNEEDE